MSRRTSSGPSEALSSLDAFIVELSFIDLSHVDHHNLLHDDVFFVLREWISNGMVAGVWLGTPCENFSRARRAPAGSRRYGRRCTCVDSPLCPARRLRGLLLVTAWRTEQGSCSSFAFCTACPAERKILLLAFFGTCLVVAASPSTSLCTRVCLTTARSGPPSGLGRGFCFGVTDREQNSLSAVAAAEARAAFLASLTSG